MSEGSNAPCYPCWHVGCSADQFICVSLPCWPVGVHGDVFNLVSGCGVNTRVPGQTLRIVGVTHGTALHTQHANMGEDSLGTVMVLWSHFHRCPFQNDGFGKERE